MAPTLDEPTARHVRELVGLNAAQSRGFEAAAQRAARPEIAALLWDYASEHRSFRTELAQFLSDPEDEGGPGDRGGASEMRGDDEAALLAEAARDEREIRDRYARALDETADTAVSGVIRRQHDVLRRRQDRLREAQRHTA